MGCICVTSTLAIRLKNEVKWMLQDSFQSWWPRQSPLWWWGYNDMMNQPIIKYVFILINQLIHLLLMMMMTTTMVRMMRMRDAPFRRHNKWPGICRTRRPSEQSWVWRSPSWMIITVENSHRKWHILTCFDEISQAWNIMKSIYSPANKHTIHT